MVSPSDRGIEKVGEADHARHQSLRTLLRTHRFAAQRKAGSTLGCPRTMFLSDPAEDPALPNTSQSAVSDKAQPRACAIVCVLLRSAMQAMVRQ